MVTRLKWKKHDTLTLLTKGLLKVKNTDLDAVGWSVKYLAPSAYHMSILQPFC